MKVSIHEIEDEKVEFVDLYIKEKTSSINTLIDYIENEKYKSIKLACYKKEQIFKITSDQIYYVETTINSYKIRCL